jgi:hypothetical protein
MSLLSLLAPFISQGVLAAQVPPPAAAQPQAITRNISGLIQPCASRTRPGNAEQRRIGVLLRVTVTPTGELLSYALVRATGVDEANRAQLSNVVDIALGALKRCAARIGTLPPEEYAIVGGWRTFQYRFRFP